jgi:hypothetical protein
LRSREHPNWCHPSVEFGRRKRMVPPPCSEKAMRPCFGARFWSPDGRGGRWSGLAARLFGSGIPCLAYSFNTGLTSERTLCAVRPGWRSLERSLGNQPATFQWAASTQWAARTQQAATSRPLRRPGPSGRLGLRPIDGPRRWALPARRRAVPGSRKISPGLARSPGSSESGPPVSRPLESLNRCHPSFQPEGEWCHPLVRRR